MNIDQPISISDGAAREIKNILQNKNIPKGYALRIGLRGGGCSGAASYVLGFDMPAQTDGRYKVADIPVVIDNKHLMYLLDLAIDFEETAESRGFIFKDNTTPEQ